VSSPPTVLEIVRKSTDFLQDKGVESPRLSAEILIGHALGLKRMQLYLQFERLLTEPELERIRPLVRRRGKREPAQYIMGEADFSGLRLKVDLRALIPRPETELFVETILARLPVAPSRVLDLGTGSGAIALALARAWPEAAFTAADASTEALGLARENAEAGGVAPRIEFLQSDWFAGISGGARFGLIVANPPYLSGEELAEAAPEVRDFEPHQALVAAEGGIAALRAIIADAPRFLAPGGLLALETGIAHHAELLRLAGDKGFTDVESLKDLTGRDRFVFARRAV